MYSTTQILFCITIEFEYHFIFIYFYIYSHWSAKGVTPCNDENKENRAQVNTKLFRSSPEVPQQTEDKPVARGD